MKKLRIEDSGARGWFVGSFPEAAHKTDLAEVCYRVEEYGPRQKHYHTRCTEILYVISGSCIQNGQHLKAGDITILEPGEVNDSFYLESSQVIGIKTPAGGDDKVNV